MRNRFRCFVLASLCAAHAAAAAEPAAPQQWTVAPFTLVSDPLVVLHDALLTTALKAADHAECLRDQRVEAEVLFARPRAPEAVDLAARYCERYTDQQAIGAAGSVSIAIAQRGCTGDRAPDPCAGLRAVLPQFIDGGWRALAAANMQWAERFVADRQRAGAALDARLAALLQLPPLGERPLTLYLVSRGGELDAYSVGYRGSFATFMSTRSDKLSGLAALEFSAHEALHAPWFTRAARVQAGETPRRCDPMRTAAWHAAIFVASGTATEQALHDAGVAYVPHYRRTDIVERLFKHRERAHRFKTLWADYIAHRTDAAALYGHLRQAALDDCAAR